MVYSNNVDKVFEDLLADDFINVFKPVLNVQRVLGTLGVNFDYGFATPQTRGYKIYSCSTWLVNSLCILYSVISCRTQFDYLSTDVPLKLGMILNGAVCVNLAWNSLCYSGHSKSQLYVKLQKIDRSLKMKNEKALNRKLYLISLLTVVNSTIFFVIWILLFNKYVISDFCPTATFASVVSSASCYEILHIFTIIYFVSIRVQYIMEQLQLGNDVAMDTKISFTKPDVLKTSEKIKDELVHGMSHILDSFSDTMDIYQNAIFFFTFQLLAWQLITMQNFVISFKTQVFMNFASLSCTLPTSLIYMTLMLVLCSTSGSLETKLEKCEKLCIALTSSLDEGKSRQNAKRIICLVKGKRDATVFDIFTLNTGLLLRLLAMTASYTIVLLQLATL